MELVELVRRVGSVDPACRDRGVLTGAVADVARVQSWLEGQRVRLAGQMAAVVSFPEKALADAARGSLQDAGRDLERGRTVDVMPALGLALSAGTSPVAMSMSSTPRPAGAITIPRDRPATIKTT